MVAYVTLRDDKFGPLRSKLTSEEARTELKSKVVRRPMHGMELPEDSYGTLTIRSASGKALKVLSNTSESAVTKQTYTTNMIIQSIGETRQEKQQIIETFGDDFVYYYGERPRVLQISAILPESVEFQYAQEFWTNYDRALRGTRLVMRDARVFLNVAGQVFEGYLSTANTNKSADQPRVIRLSLQMYVTHSYYIEPLRNSKWISKKAAVGGAAASAVIGGARKADPPISVMSRYIDQMKGDYIRLPDHQTKIEYEDSVEKFRDDKSTYGKTSLITRFLSDTPFSFYAGVYRQIEVDAMLLHHAIMGGNGRSLVLRPGSGIFGASAQTESRLSKAGTLVGKALSVIGGGIIVAGAVGAIAEDFKRFDGSFTDYLNARLVEPVVDEFATFIGDAGDIAEGLFSAGYTLVSPSPTVSKASVEESSVIRAEGSIAEDAFIGENPFAEEEISVPSEEALLFVEVVQPPSRQENFLDNVIITEGAQQPSSQETFLDNEIGL